MKLQITTIIFILLSITKVWACTCIGDENIRRAFRSADLVITGTIIDSQVIRIWGDTTYTRDGFDYWIRQGRFDSTTNYREWKNGNIAVSIQKIDYTVIIENRLKGRRNRDTIVVRTGFGDCGFPFRRGEKYLIYAIHERGITYFRGAKNRPRKELRGIFHTNVCTRTKFASSASEELMELGTD